MIELGRIVDGTPREIYDYLCSMNKDTDEFTLKYIEELGHVCDYKHDSKYLRELGLDLHALEMDKEKNNTILVLLILLVLFQKVKMEESIGIS